MSEPDVDNGNLAGRLRQIRRDRGLTLAALSRSSGVSVSYLSAVEKGINQPSLHTLAAITEALGASIPEVLSHEVQTPIRRARLPEQAPDTVELSHSLLDLRSCVISARPGDHGASPLDLADRNLFLYVVVGSLVVRVSGAEYNLDVGDALDATRPQEVTWHSSASSTVVWTSSPVRSGPPM